LSQNFEKDKLGNPDWSGGPMYCLGGRSCVWGLFAPRPHDNNLHKHFPKAVLADLTSTYFKKAEDLMNIYLPRTKPVHQNLIDSLNMKMSDEKIPTQWQWGRIASEFCDNKNFDFAQGAYSTVDKLLEIAMTNANQSDESKKQFKILLNAEVTKLCIPSGKDPKTIGVTVGDSGERLYGKDVVLCAGSVNSLGILLRSPDINLENDEKTLGHLTDHDIFFIEATYNYKDPTDRATIGAMKLQTYVQVADLDAIANVSIDASSFLPRNLAKIDESPPTMDDSPKFIMVFILPAILNERNHITYKDGQSTLEMHRWKIEDPQGAKQDMSKMVKITMRTLKSILGVNFTKLNGLPFTDVETLPDDGSFLNRLPLGAVAHELGSIPMPGSDGTTKALTTDLQLKDHPNIWICDLSVFPSSPAANPSLTLAALALRLSDKLLTTVVPSDSRYLTVVNYSLQDLEVRVTSSAGKSLIVAGKTRTFKTTAADGEAIIAFKKGTSQVYQQRYGHAGDVIYIE
jgi:hypothetical protein